MHQFSSVQSFSRVQLFATPWIAARQASLSITNSRSLPKPMSIKLVMPSSHLILCHPLLLLPPILPSIKVFSNESTLRMRLPKYRSFSFNISSSKEHPGLISFRMDWLDLLAGQGTLKSLLQHHSSKASVLWCSAFFTVQLSHPYMTTGKTIALTSQKHCWQSNVSAFYLFIYFYFLIFIFTLCYFTILYWFCHTLTWIHHGCICVPKHEPPSHLPPHNISLGHPRAPAPSMLYPALDIEYLCFLICCLGWYNFPSKE